MARKIAVALAATVLSSVILVAAGSGVAHAASFGVNQPGKVTCSPAHGVWNGTISFTPPLFNGGSASTEVVVVKAALGNTASPCVATTGIAVLGSIAGKLTFTIPGTANNCAT